MSLLTRLFDERFLAHRQRSTSTAGMISAALSLVLFEYRFAVTHVLDWGLLAVGATFVIIKLSLMLRYALRD